MTSYLSRLLSTQAIKRAPLHFSPKRTVFSFTEPRLDTIDVAELPPKDIIQFQNAYQHFISQYGQSRPNSDGVSVTEARLMTTSDLSHSLEEHVFQSDNATLNPLSTFMPGLPKIVIDELEHTKQTLLTF